VPTVQPVPPSPQRSAERSNASGIDATTKVSPARPTPGARPESARPEQKKEAPGDSGEPGRQGSGQGGSNGAEHANRSASASRSG